MTKTYKLYANGALVDEYASLQQAEDDARKYQPTVWEIDNRDDGFVVERVVYPQEAFPT